MATRNIRTIQAVGYTASADLSGYQYCFVKSAGAKTVALQTTAGDPVFGILQNAPTANLAAEIDVIGFTKVKLGAAVAAGAQVMCEATTGRAITATTGEVAVGYVPDGGGDGEVVEVVLYGNAQLN